MMVAMPALSPEPGLLVPRVMLHDFERRIKIEVNGSVMPGGARPVPASVIRRSGMSQGSTLDLIPASLPACVEVR